MERELRRRLVPQFGRTRRIHFAVWLGGRWGCSWWLQRSASIAPHLQPPSLIGVYPELFLKHWARKAASP